MVGDGTADAGDANAKPANPATTARTSVRRIDGLLWLILLYRSQRSKRSRGSISKDFPVSLRDHKVTEAASDQAGRRARMSLHRSFELVRFRRPAWAVWATAPGSLRLFPARSAVVPADLTRIAVKAHPGVPVKNEARNGSLGFDNFLVNRRLNQSIGQQSDR